MAASDFYGTKIYGSDFSRAARSHWALRELGLDSTVARVDVPIDVRTGKIYADDEEMAKFYRERLHPDSRMPVLATPDEAYTLFESLAINYYLAKKAGGPLAPRDMEEEARIMQWSIWVIANCEDACVKLMFAGMARDKAKAAKRKAPLFKALVRPFEALDRHLSRSEFLLGGVDRGWTIADLNVASIISWGIEAGMELQQFPSLRKWWEATIARPAYAAKTLSPKL